jgi:DNA repair exonuclease SbcCD ATPase subunit
MFDEKEYQKAYAESHKEHLKEYKKAYRLANLEKIKKHSKKYRNANKDKIKETNRIYHAENKDERNKQMTKYRIANRDKLNEIAKSKRTPEKNKKYAIKSTYGLTLEQYNSMLNQTGGKCPICDVEFKRKGDGGGKHPCVDHCHKTGKVRGIICSKCNAGIGNLNDNIQRIRKAADWLESFG